MPPSPSVTPIHPATCGRGWVERKRGTSASVDLVRWFRRRPCRESSSRSCVVRAAGRPGRPRRGAACGRAGRRSRPEAGRPVTWRSRRYGRGDDLPAGAWRGEALLGAGAEEEPEGGRPDGELEGGAGTQPEEGVGGAAGGGRGSAAGPRRAAASARALPARTRVHALAAAHARCLLLLLLLLICCLRAHC